jgi:hypothetical protein
MFNTGLAHKPMHFESNMLCEINSFRHGDNFENSGYIHEIKLQFLLQHRVLQTVKIQE